MTLLERSSLIVAVLVLASAAASQQADPFGAEATVPPTTADEDPIRPPFVCVLPPGLVGDDPAAFIRDALSNPEAEWPLAIADLPSGIRIARLPQIPRDDGGPAIRGELHRKAMEACLPILRAMSEETLAKLVQGEIVNLTPLRAEIDAAFAGLVAGTPRTREEPVTAERLATADLLLGRLRVALNITVEQPVENGGAYMLIQMTRDPEPPSLRHVQLDDEGKVCWSEADIRRASIPRASPRWCAFPARPTPPKLMYSHRTPPLRAALAERADAVRLKELNGVSVGDALAYAGDLARCPIGLGPELNKARLFCVGDDVLWCDALDAILASAWARSAYDAEALKAEPRATNWPIVWEVCHGARGQDANSRLQGQARRQHVPELSAEVDAFLAPSLMSLLWQEHGAPLDLFRTGWSGRIGQLPEEEREWLKARVAEALDVVRSTPKFGSTYAWLGEQTDSLRFTFYPVYNLLLGVSVADMEFVAPTKTFAPWEAPDSLYDELGADRARPIRSCATASLSFY